MIRMSDYGSGLFVILIMLIIVIRQADTRGPLSHKILQLKLSCLHGEAHIFSRHAIAREGATLKRLRCFRALPRFQLLPPDSSFGWGFGDAALARPCSML